MTATRTDPPAEQQGISTALTSNPPTPLREETVVTYGATGDTIERRASGGAGTSAVGETIGPAGVASTRTVTRDVVGERRRTVALVTQVIWFVVGLIESLLALRLILLLTGANPEASFTRMILGFTKMLVALFLGIFPNVVSGGSEFEPASVVAMLIYFLAGLGVARLIWILYGEPREIA